MPPAPSAAFGVATNPQTAVSRASMVDCGATGSSLRRRAWTRSFTTFVAVATMLGLALRIAAAQGDLGLDEVWSLRLVAELRNLGAVFWGLPHDNNHVLNSAWLFVLGQDCPAWLYRLPAVVLGTLTVPAVARWLGRTRPAAGRFGAILAAVALPLVDFGSEARGYAGLALATVLALDEADRATDDALHPERHHGGWARWRLGLAIGLGLFSHLAMVDTVAVVGLVALWRLGAVTRRIGPTLRAAVRIFLPSLVLALPAAACLLTGIVSRGGFRIGDTAPFSLAGLADGFGGMLLLTAGVPDSLVPGVVGIVLAFVVVGVAARRGLIDVRTVRLAVAALIVFPTAVIIAQLPNVGYARYFAVCGIVLLAIEAEVLGAVWQRPGAARRRALLAAGILLLGSLGLDGLEIRDGRGGFGETLALMRQEGAPTYATDRPAMAAILLGGAAARQGVAAPTRVPDAEACRAVADWYIAVGLYDPRPDGTAMVGPAACPTHYRVRKPFQASPLSGTQWTLYRRG